MSGREGGRGSPSSGGNSDSGRSSSSRNSGSGRRMRSGGAADPVADGIGDGGGGSTVPLDGGIGAETTGRCVGAPAPRLGTRRAGARGAGRAGGSSGGSRGASSTS